MDISQNLSQEQKLSITLEMKQSLELLQLPISELLEFIEIQLQENPMLEKIEETKEFSEKIFNSEELQSINQAKEKDLNPEKLLKNLEWNNYSNDYAYENNLADELQSPLNYISEKLSLKQYLNEQLIDLKESKLVISICKYIIENIDNRGYLGSSVIIIAKELNVTNELVQYSLSLVQDFQPIGIAARSLVECLKLQINKKGIFDQVLIRIIDEYFELLADNKLKEIGKALGIDIKKVQEYLNIIKTLEPKPSRGFYTGEEINYAMPEAYIKKIGSEYYILMNDDILPDLKINSLYKDIIKIEKDNNSALYLKDKLNSALSLIKGIDHRQNTIYRVIEKILQLQREYFDRGEDYLKPMTIKDIADSLKCHQSTISRAIKQKYINTPTKTTKIKDLFINGITSTSTLGVDIATNQIKNTLKILIEKEDKIHPWSDQKLAEELNKNSIGIARRTVTKYREELGIQSSSKRKIFSI